MHPEFSAVLARQHSDELIRRAGAIADIRRFEQAAAREPRRRLTVAGILTRYFGRGEQAHQQRVRRAQPGTHRA